MRLNNFLIIAGLGVAFSLNVNAGLFKKKNDEKKEQVCTEYKMKNSVDSLSYSLGISIANNLKENFDSLDPKSVGQAFYDVYFDTVKMTLDEADMFIRGYIMALQEEEGLENKKKGEAFLSENSKKEGVVTTESGLQYLVMEEGTGSAPSESDRVSVHYKGTLIDGTVFDSSYERGQPAQFGVTQVIKGWTEALQLMKEGAKYKLFIPSDLAYGPRGNQSIGPNQVLIFEVELLEIVE